MRIECPRCDEPLSFEQGDLPRGGRRLVCAACGKTVVMVPRVAWGAPQQPVSGHGQADRMWASRGAASGLTGTPGPAGAFEPIAGSVPDPSTDANTSSPDARGDLPESSSTSSWVLASLGLLLVLIGLGLALGAVFRDEPGAEMAVER